MTDEVEISYKGEVITDQTCLPKPRKKMQPEDTRPVKEIRNEGKPILFTQKEMVTALRTKLLTGKQRSLAWRVMQKGFWSEDHYRTVLISELWIMQATGG